MYYSYDGMRNVTELTDRHGDSIEQYRYDAFGGLYTGVTAPYNTNSFAGKNYDAKANLIDMNARWYGAQNGRFTTADQYQGDILTPYTQNRYAYVGNNPINRWDPLGYWEDGDSSLSSAAQADIRYLTKLYNSTDDKDERESLHEVANEIRNLDRDRWTTEDERKIGSLSDDTPDMDYETPIKLSDGWRTDWTRTDRYYEKYEVTRQRHTAYVGVISTTVSVRTDTTTTVTNGFDFRAFTPSEWYQENKAVLKQYHIPISQVNSYYEPKDGYSKTTSSSRSISSTEKIMSRNDNNDYKNGIISQGLEVAGVSEKIVGIGKNKRRDKGTVNPGINVGKIEVSTASLVAGSTTVPLAVPTTVKLIKDNPGIALTIGVAVVTVGVYEINTKINTYVSEKIKDVFFTDEVKTPSVDYPGNDPTVAPGEDYVWRGKGTPADGKGSYFNPKTGESLHPDLGHPEPIGPHWDYKGPDGSQWRVNPDGSVVPK